MQKPVSGRYVIDNQIIFVPAHLRLINTSNQNSLQLKEPAARCLYMMLSNHGKLISQNELMAYAWGDNHRQVPSNSFYQAILVLRKSLILSGAERDIIVTLPRKGLLIPDNISVAFFPDNTDIDIDTAEAEITPELPSSSEGNLRLESVSSAQDHAQSNDKRPFHINKWSVIFLVILFINALYLVLFLTHRSADHYFNEYEKISYPGESCNVLLNPQSGDRSRQIAFLKYHPELCQNEGSLYVTSYQNSSAISIFICTQPFATHTPENCTPYFYPDYFSETEK